MEGKNWLILMPDTTTKKGTSVQFYDADMRLFSL